MIALLRLLYPLVLAIRGGEVSAAKGKVPARLLREIRETVAGAGVARGSIHADGAGRIHFSSSVPAELHQPLRNILSSL